MRLWNGYIKGINLGGWLSQCDYKYEHHESFITEKDIELISAAGLDHVRMPVDYNVLRNPDGSSSERGFGYIDSCIEWCLKRNLNVIIDLHKTEGFSFDDDANLLFDNEELQKKFLLLWHEIASRYSKYNRNVAFELLNEVVEQDSLRWNVLLNKAIEVVRKAAPTSYIVIGGIQWNSVHTLHLLDLPDDENLILNFHFYEPFLFTHQGASWHEIMAKNGDMNYPATIETYREKSKQLGCFGSGLDNVSKMGEEFMAALMMSAVKVAEERNLPLYCGEYGTIDLAPVDDVISWYKDVNAVFNRLGIGRAAWSYKSMSFGLSDSYDGKSFNDFAIYL